MSQLIRVVAPHFTAGMCMTGDVCTEAAPILKWAIGKSRDDLRRYFAKKGWLAMQITLAVSPVDNEDDAGLKG